MEPERTPSRPWAVTALLLAGLLAVPAAAAATITSATGPLTNVWVDTDLACQVSHIRDTTSYEFYPPSTAAGDCGTFLVVGGTLYAPNFAGHGTTATGSLGAYTAFGAVSQTAVTGLGTAATPYQVVTVVNVGTTGLQITETDLYVVGDDFYHTDVKIASTLATATSARLYRAGDCYLGASDWGYGATAISAGSVACSENANNSPNGRFEEFIPLTAGSSYYEDLYDDVWAWIGGHTAFPNTCDCPTYQDNGAGLSWDITVPAHGSVTVSSSIRFSIPAAPASCLADAILVTERDASGGSARVPFAESRASASPTPGSYTPPPPLAASTVAHASRPLGTAHADAELHGVHYQSTLGVRVDAATVHSRCDVNSVDDPGGPTTVPGVHEDAYGIGGVEDLAITVLGNSITLKALDLEELALGDPTATSATWACDVVDVGHNPPNPVAAVCALASAALACKPPLNLVCGTVSVGINEVSGPVFDPATGQWTYTASLLHINVNPLLANAAVIDIYVGHVELSVSGGPAAWPVYVPHVGCLAPPQLCT
ncbi:MAG: hypothetical protein QOG31_143 [Thermoplasmata archaeon]|jgi:hypothetical protein|nr:hypothetical protein [Thermoplasmata archaeon]